MKKILFTLFLFIITVKLLDITGFHILRYFYEHTYVGQDGGDINKYLHDNDPPQMIIMGSSTTRFQVNPDSFPGRSCNLSRALTTDCYQLGLLSLMIQKNKTPKTILLALWPRNYLQHGKKDRHPEDALFLRNFYDESDYVRNEINAISFFEKYKFLFSSYRFNGMVTNTVKYYYLGLKQKDTGYYFKYQRSNLNDSINIIAALKKRNRLNTAASLPLSSLNTAYLARLIDTCKKHNINLLCYYMPMLDEDENLIRNGVDFMDSILAVKKIPLLKFTKDNATHLFNTPGYWIDGLHMNEKGGSIQSAMLAAFVRTHQK